MVLGACHNHRIHLACLHLPHSKRTGSEHNPRATSEEVWQESSEKLDAALEAAYPADSLILGGDFNQDLHAPSDSFAGMGLLRTVIHRHGFSTHEPVGHTWGARGSSSEIDALLIRVSRGVFRAHKRDDMRQALPSDHSPVFCRVVTPQPLLFRGRRVHTRCGRWLPKVADIEEYARSGEAFCHHMMQRLCENSSRVPSLRYRDSAELKRLIAERKGHPDPATRAHLLKQIRQQRSQDRTDHQPDILQRAREGDRQAISYLRNSAAHSSFETSYIERRGGQQAASKELRQFYEKKYTSFLPPPTVEAVRRMISTHTSVRPAPFSPKELSQAIARCKPHTSAGLDGVCYEAIIAYHRVDKAGRLLEFMNSLLFK